MGIYRTLHGLVMSKDSTVVISGRNRFRAAPGKLS